MLETTVTNTIKKGVLSIIKSYIEKKSASCTDNTVSIMVFVELYQLLWVRTAVCLRPNVRSVKKSPF